MKTSSSEQSPFSLSIVLSLYVHTNGISSCALNQIKKNLGVCLSFRRYYSNKNSSQRKTVILFIHTFTYTNRGEFRCDSEQLFQSYCQLSDQDAIKIDGKCNRQDFVHCGNRRCVCRHRFVTSWRFQVSFSIFWGVHFIHFEFR